MLKSGSKIGNRTKAPASRTHSKRSRALVHRRARSRSVWSASGLPALSNCFGPNEPPHPSRPSPLCPPPAKAEGKTENASWEAQSVQQVAADGLEMPRDFSVKTAFNFRARIPDKGAIEFGVLLVNQILSDQGDFETS